MAIGETLQVLEFLTAIGIVGFAGTTYLVALATGMSLRDSARALLLLDRY